MDREAFLATYVELRSAAIAANGGLSDSARSAILERRGVTEDGLLAFIEQRSGDLPYMRALWDEVEVRMGSVAEAAGAEDGGSR